MRASHEIFVISVFAPIGHDIDCLLHRFEPVGLTHVKMFKTSGHSTFTIAKVNKAEKPHELTFAKCQEALRAAEAQARHQGRASGAQRGARRGAGRGRGLQQDVGPEPTPSGGSSRGRGRPRGRGVRGSAS